MIELIKSAPYDTALLVVTLVYSLLVFRLFREVDDRDHTFAARMQRWQDQLEAAARERQQKSPPSPAE